MRFELLGDAVGDQLRVDLGLAHSSMLTATGTRQAARQLGLQVLDVLALLADHDARPRRVDRDAGVLRRALDQDARHGGVLQPCLQEVAHLQVFGQHRREVLACRRTNATPQLRVTCSRNRSDGFFCPMFRARTKFRQLPTVM